MLIFVEKTCVSNPCQNGGSCFSKVFKTAETNFKEFSCECTKEYTGVLCQERSMLLIRLLMICMSAIATAKFN